jgi:FKBP-type peptidyl-prolyl cis-trans isomerase
MAAHMPALTLESQLFSLPNHPCVEAFQNEPSTATQLIKVQYVVVLCISIGTGAHKEFTIALHYRGVLQKGTKNDILNLQLKLPFP